MRDFFGRLGLAWIAFRYQKQVIKSLKIFNTFHDEDVKAFSIEVIKDEVVVSTFKCIREEK